MSKTIEEIRREVEHESDALPNADARALLAHADSLQAGLDGATARIAELEAKLENVHGQETANRLRDQVPRRA